MSLLAGLCQKIKKTIMDNNSIVIFNIIKFNSMKKGATQKSCKKVSKFFLHYTR